MLQPVKALRTDTHPYCVDQFLKNVSEVNSRLFLDPASVRWQDKKCIPGHPQITRFRGKGGMQHSQDPGKVMHITGVAPSLT